MTKVPSTRLPKEHSNRQSQQIGASPGGIYRRSDWVFRQTSFARRLKDVSHQLKTLVLHSDNLDVRQSPLEAVGAFETVEEYFEN